MIRIIVAFQNSRTARQIREVVEGSGRTACVPCPTVAAVRRTLLAQHITGVVSGVKFPDGTVADLALDLPRGCGLLVLALPEQLALCPEEGILRLAAPVSRRELLASVRMLTKVPLSLWGRRPATARRSGGSSGRPRSCSWPATAWQRRPPTAFCRSRAWIWG